MKNHMEHTIDRAAWQEVSILRPQFLANLEALRAREPVLAERISSFTPEHPYLLAAIEQRIVLARRCGDRLDPLPNPVPPASARNIVHRLFAAGQCSEPVLVAGLDQGWLWSALHELPVGAPRAPGHRPPLYFLSSSVEQLWVVMHLHEWTALLADPRVRMFVGADAIEQLRQSLIEQPRIPWPRLCVTVDQSLWTNGASVDSLLQSAQSAASARLAALRRQTGMLAASVDPHERARRLTDGKLRVLGITSRFTTFLQYSMRDWLAAFAETGHETHLLIETADHEIANPLHFAEVCGQFRPDLILLIDHYRGEFSGLPLDVPCVMWVQDRLPNIFRPAAGAAQQPMDYCLGYGRQECVVSHGYPRERFMPAMVGFNHCRFASAHPDQSPDARYACDVSFVSHASETPESLVQQEIEKTRSVEAKRFLRSVLDRLREIYDAEGFVTETAHIRRMIDDSLRECGVKTNDMSGLFDFFVQKVNNALFRQQAIGWLADMGFDLHLYGRGWEQHPRLGRFARGVADNEHQLAAIYRSSRINLQITPFGAVHQRLFDGLAAGGFFLLRHCTGDVCDLIYRQMWQWCQDVDIRSGRQFFLQAPPTVRRMIDRIIELTGEDPEPIAETFFLGLEEAASAGFTRSPATLWEAEYERVAFRTRDDLLRRVAGFLEAPDERAAIAESMRARVIECMSYTGITRRLLHFIADDIRARHARLLNAA